MSILIIKKPDKERKTAKNDNFFTPFLVAHFRPFV